MKRKIEQLQNDSKNVNDVAVLQKEMKSKEDEWLHKEEECKRKLETVEKALNVKMQLLLEHLRRDLQIVLQLLFCIRIRIFFTECE